MSTSLSEKELGVVQAVLDRYNREWSLLSKAIEEARGGATFAKSHPEFKNLVDKATELYNHIEARNEENGNSNGQR